MNRTLLLSVILSIDVVAVAAGPCPFDSKRETGWYVLTWTKGDGSDCSTHGPFTYSDEAVNLDKKEEKAGRRTSGAFYHIRPADHPPKDKGKKGLKIEFPDKDENVWIEYKKEGDRFYLWVVNKDIGVYRFDSKILAGNAGTVTEKNFTLHASKHGDKYLAVHFGRNDDIFFLAHLSPEAKAKDKWKVDGDAGDGLAKYGCGQIGLRTTIRFFEDDRAHISFGLKGKPPCAIKYDFNKKQKRFEIR